MQQRAPRSARRRKSEATRQVIVDMTLACLVKHGYHATTYPRIAAAAGFSRGAMRYHFPTRRDVMAAAIEHLHRKRLRAFRRAAASMPDGGGRTGASLAALWNHVNHPMFLAFIDLELAARRDRNLAALLRPTRDTFRRELYDTALELFPEWRGRGDQLRTAMELSQYMMEGMVLDGLGGEDESTHRLLDFLARQLLTLQGQATTNTGRK